MIDRDGHTYKVNSDFRLDYYLLRILAITTAAFAIIGFARLYGYGWSLVTFLGCSIGSALQTWLEARKDR